MWRSRIVTAIVIAAAVYMIASNILGIKACFETLLLYLNRSSKFPPPPIQRLNPESPPLAFTPQQPRSSENLPKNILPSEELKKAAEHLKSGSTTTETVSSTTVTTSLNLDD
jgi:hypothetical protein